MDQLKTIETAEVAEAAAQYIVVRLGEEQYGIDIRYVDNIVRMQHITRVPKVASYIRGVINLRGEVIPVMSIRLKMGLPEDVEVKSTRIIILKHEQHGTIGIIVDEVKEVVTLTTDCIEKWRMMEMRIRVILFPALEKRRRADFLTGSEFGLT